MLVQLDQIHGLTMYVNTEQVLFLKGTKAGSDAETEIQLQGGMTTTVKGDIHEVAAKLNAALRNYAHDPAPVLAS